MQYTGKRSSGRKMLEQVMQKISEFIKEDFMEVYMKFACIFSFQSKGNLLLANLNNQILKLIDKAPCGVAGTSGASQSEHFIFHWMQRSNKLPSTSLSTPTVRYDVGLGRRGVFCIRKRRARGILHYASSIVCCKISK